MHLPPYQLTSAAEPATTRPALVSYAPYADVQWNRPIFRAPSLPTPAQVWSDLPFTTRFRAKDVRPKS